MLEEIDSFDYVLAESLGKHLHEIRALPNSEVVEWRAFFTYRQAMEEIQRGK